MAKYRRLYIENAIKFIWLFENHEYVTAKMVANHLDICLSNAHRWIRDASLAMPIYNYGKLSTWGRSSIKYGLMKYEEEKPSVISTGLNKKS